MNRTFSGKIAVVTGGGSGIGAAMSEQLARHGALVTVVDINETGAHRVVDGITRAGGKASLLIVDVTKPEQMQQLVDDVFARQGRIDYLFNNAGIALVADARDMTLEQWQRVLAVNLHGVVHGVAAAYPRMAAQGFGHIINTASMAGLIPAPGLAAYSTTKHAVVGLSMSLRAEGAALGVKVSAVCPGVINTPIIDAGEYVRIDSHRILDMMPVAPTDVNVAARGILRGVARNQSIIIVPFSARAVWWLQRLAPGVFLRFAQHAMARLRRLRQ